LLRFPGSVLGRRCRGTPSGFQRNGNLAAHGRVPGAPLLGVSLELRHSLSQSGELTANAPQLLLAHSSELIVKALQLLLARSSELIVKALQLLFAQ
jgi:hypothetical protein